MKTFIILPHQLFNYKHLDKTKKIILWEHPQYFTKYKFNKKKLILHRASMKYYYDYLKKKDFKVKYINFNEKMTKKEYQIFDPIDKIKLPNKAEIIESPNFLLTKNDYAEYRQKTDKFLFYNFYMWSKKKLDLIPNVKSTDKENRKKLPKDIQLPKQPKITKKDDEYVEEAIKYVNTHFSKNYGNTEKFNFPVTHSTAKKWLKLFLENKFKNFGSYQDSIIIENNKLFHSLLSSSINIGLLNPSDLVKGIFKYKSKVPMNSFEGYLRQLFWREYQRYTYIYYDFSKENYFGNRKKLNKKWYTGETGIDPVDDCIKRGFDTGYLHHIERLMVVGNYMNLDGIAPKEGFKWFMEFSCDSYEWVMNQNVLDMVFFVSGGKTMRKPYASSSNYILKMSNYKKGKWSETWTNKYHQFMKKNKEKLWKFRYSFPGLKNY